MKAVTFLVVDDNRCDQMLVAKALEESHRGTNLQQVLDGEEALAYLRHEEPFQQAPRPDIILLDLNLPRKGGREVLAEIRGEVGLRDIPVVVWTGALAAPEMRSIRLLNPDFVITKPNDLEEFFQAVQAIEGYAQSLTDSPHNAGSERRAGTVGKDCLESGGGISRPSHWRDSVGLP
ncbi:MAG: response regulator [Deltaproteobacteria bacterium]|nr:response regulator [Deltaproteobacteria bacterium]